MKDDHLYVPHPKILKSCIEVFSLLKNEFSKPLTNFTVASSPALCTSTEIVITVKIITSGSIFARRRTARQHTYLPQLHGHLQQLPVHEFCINGFTGEGSLLHTRNAQLSLPEKTQFSIHKYQVEFTKIVCLKLFPGSTDKQHPNKDSLHTTYI